MNVLLIAFVTLAPDPIELSRASVVERAATQNPRVAAARAREAEAQAQGAQADAARWPILTAEAGIGSGMTADLVSGTAAQSEQSRYDFGFDDLTATVAGRVSVLQPLLTFGKIGLREDAARAAREAREAQTDITRAEVALRSAELYEGLLYARATIRFFEEMQHRLEQTVESTESQMQAEGSTVSEKDLLRVEAALQLVALGLHRARAGEAKARVGLRAYLGLEADRKLTLADASLTDLDRELPSVSELVRIARNHRPELRALRRGERAEQLLAAAERAGYYPDVFLMGFAVGAYTPERDLVESRYLTDPLYFANAGVLAGVRWQIQGAMPSTLAAQAEARAERMKHRAEWALDGILAQVRTTYEDLEQAERDMESARKGAERTKKWLVRAQADYGMGLGPSDDVTDAAEAYLGLRLEELRARYQFNRSLAALAQSAGTLTGSTKENPYLQEK